MGPPPTSMAICSNIHLVPSNQRAFIRDLRSVTYHLPLDFWTSLLLKLCDLAVHTVKVQKKNPVEVIQCVCLCEAEGERQCAAQYKVHFCMHTVFMFVHVRLH